MYTCSKCKETKPLAMYHKDKGKKNGHQSVCKACRLAYQRTKPEKFAKANKKYAKTHPPTEEQREKNRKRSLAYQKENLGRYAAATRKYKLAKMNRTPEWADNKAIVAFYEGCPEGHHVDHIVPLQGHNVSGLHVLENLQYLPALENIAKGNRYE